MSYYAKHAIWVEACDDDLTTLRNMICDRSGYCFDIGSCVVCDDNGESVERVCINDYGWNCGCGVTWYDFESDMREVSEHFAAVCPDKIIHVYLKDEYGYEFIYEFCDGRTLYFSRVIRYREILEGVCDELNTADFSPYELACVRQVSGCPLVTFRNGAYVMVGFNVFELVRIRNRFVFGTKELGDCAFHYECLPEKAEAMKMLYEYLIVLRKKGELFKWS